MTNVALSKPGVDPSLQSVGVRLGLSILAALLTGGILGLLHALLSIQYKVNQIVSGTVINILALGLTGYFYELNTPTLGKLPSVISNPWTQAGSYKLRLASNFNLYLP